MYLTGVSHRIKHFDVVVRGTQSHFLCASEPAPIPNRRGIAV